VLRMLSYSAETLKERAAMLCGEIKARGGLVEIVPTKSVAGGGAVPGLELDSYAIAVVSAKSADSAVAAKSGNSAEQIDRKLRALSIPIIGHIVNDKLIIDIRTVFEDDYDYLVDAIVQI